MLRTIGIVPRFSKLWRKIYNRQGSIERWSSSAKRSRLLGKRQLLRMGKTRLHTNLSMLKTDSKCPRFAPWNLNQHSRGKMQEPLQTAIGA